MPSSRYWLLSVDCSADDRILRHSVTLRVRRRARLRPRPVSNCRTDFRMIPPGFREESSTISASPKYGYPLGLVDASGGVP